MLERWRRTLDAIPQMVWTVAGDGSDAFFNAQWLNFTGSRVSSFKQLSQADFIHHEDRPRVIALWNERFATGEPYEAQYRLKHIDGGHRWILSRGAPEKDPDGETVRWYGTCTDIHEEVIARQALQASEAVNRSMIEASPDCISLLDMDGKVRFLNRAAIEALGWGTSTLPLGHPWVMSSHMRCEPRPLLPSKRLRQVKRVISQLARRKLTDSDGGTLLWHHFAAMVHPSEVLSPLPETSHIRRHQRTEFAGPQITIP
jgi:PAS domain S-box-containing protein